MPFLLPTSSFKSTAAVVIVGVFSVAAALSFTVPSVLYLLVSCFPIVYDNTVFLLKPPYLYLVINCIIVSIVATSKLTHKSSSVDDSVFSQVVTLPVPSDINTGYPGGVHHVASDYTGYDAPVDFTVEDVRKSPEVMTGDELIVDGIGQKKPNPSSDSRELEIEKAKPSSDSQELETEKPKPSSDIPELEIEKPKPSSDSPELETEKPKSKIDWPEISISKQTRKPPRFSQQKTLKANPEGGNKKTALGVTKPPRRQDTLETTWKKITEGRSTPLTKHLKKSDTWQEHSHVQSSSSSEKKKKKKTTKSENLDDVNAATKETHRTRLKREASPGQEELNRRVEAFIKKFNEEMRLQRLESLAKYNEIVNGGTRL